MISKKQSELIANKKSAFTLMEIIIAAGVLAIFIGVLMSLFSGGSSMTNKNLWLSTVTNQLKLACRQITTSVKASGYPTCLRYPNSITERKTDIFGVHFYDNLLMATQTAEVSEYNGSIFLALTEAKPAKLGFTDSRDKAELNYHIFALNKQGMLTYSKYSEEVAGTSVQSLSVSSIPSSDSLKNPGMRAVLARDVESVECQKLGTGDKSPVSVRITCKMPRSNTSRSEVAVGTPNVSVQPHDNLGDMNK